MRFLHIDPAAHRVIPVEAASPSEAIPKLTALNTDHGVVTKGLGIIVYEYGLMEGDGPYFALGGQLYAGDAVLYAFNEGGETIDMPKRVDAMLPVWLDTREDVELAIAAGMILRPQASLNGVVHWEWNIG